MGKSNLKMMVENTDHSLFDSNESLKDKIKSTHTEEIIIGLCGPIGTDIHFVTDVIAEVIAEKYQYETKIIRLSDFIKKHGDFSTSCKNKFESINQQIQQGNNLREKHTVSILAELAINEIALQREYDKKKSGHDDFNTKRICYIIDSIKNNEELELFRLVYNNIFYFIGVFSNLDYRVKNLEKKELSRSEIYQLIDRDSGEEIQTGQKVTDTFVHADIFIRFDESTSSVMNSKITRCLNLIFASEIITPSIYETAMYQAFAAAGNSACLSRQVGASITNEKGEIISVGWNDVPKFNGGLYSYDENNDPISKKDFRCMNIDGGKCFNDTEKELIRTLLLNELVDNEIIDKKDLERAEQIVKKSRLKDLIEFSRAVHAEMHAIIIGSQKSGNDVINGKLFCTTYPCHNCARHIVTAGIKEVYYIEPYRKSLALKLHSDSISENDNDDNKVKILMFDGVSPRRYLDFFKMQSNSRKEQNGKKKKFDKKVIYPKNTISLQAIPILEKEVIKELGKKQLIELPDEK